MIDARNLPKRYSQTAAVDDLSFRVKAGRVAGPLGRNWSETSTTMRMIVGLNPPTSKGNP
jgi:ABC-2 type transport system ATP-binding protein